MSAMSALRGLAILEVFLFHAFWITFTAGGSSNLVSSKYNKFIPNGQIRWFIRGTMQSQWAMLAFVLMSARTDRQALEDRKPGWWRENCLIYTLWVFTAFPLPELMQLLHTALRNESNVWSTGDHRWYLVFFLGCRLVAPGLLWFDRRVQRLGSGKMAHGFKLIVLAVSFYYLTFILSMEPSVSLGPLSVVPGSPRLAALWPYVVPYKAGWYYASPGFILWLFWYYCAAFWYGKAVCSSVWSRWPKHLGAAFPLCLFLFVSALLGYLDERGNPLWTWRREALPYEFPVDALLAGLLMLSLYMVAAGPWLKRLLLVELGNASLGIYIIHLYFYVYLTDLGRRVMSFRVGILGIPFFGIVDTMAIVRPWLGSLGMLLVWLIYPFVFSLIIGPAFQKAYMGAFMAVEMGVGPVAAQVSSIWHKVFKPTAAVVISPKYKKAVETWP